MHVQGALRRDTPRSARSLLQACARWRTSCGGVLLPGMDNDGAESELMAALLELAGHARVRGGLPLGPTGMAP